MPASGPARESLARHGGIIVAKDQIGSDRARQPRRPGTPGVRRRTCRGRRAVRRRDFHRPVYGAGRRRLRHRLESRAADQRRRAIPRRPAHGGLRSHFHRSTGESAGPQESCAHGDDACADRKDWKRTRCRSRFDSDDLRASGRSRGCPAAAPEREHRRVLARRHRSDPSNHGGGCRLLPRLRGAFKGMRGVSRRARSATRADQRSRRGPAGRDRQRLPRGAAHGWVTGGDHSHACV